MKTKLNMLIVILLTILGTYTVTVTDWKVSSYSGAKEILNESGEVEDSETGLYYYKQDYRLTIRELKAIKKLEIVYLVLVDYNGELMQIELLYD